MAEKLILLAVCLFLGTVYAKPVNYNDDVELVPGASRQSPEVRVYYPTQGDNFFPDLTGIQDQVGSFFPDFTAIQDYFNNFRKKLTEYLEHSVPINIDLQNGNTTSETKIVGNNRVTINSTVYDKDGVHFVVKTVEVRPLETAEGSTTPSGTTARVNSDNDVSREKRYLWDEVDRFEDVVDNSINAPKRIEFSRPIDLSGDVNINYGRENLPINPDAEVFMADPKRKQFYEYEISIPLHWNPNHNVQMFQKYWGQREPKLLPLSERPKLQPIIFNEPSQINSNENQAAKLTQRDLYYSERQMQSPLQAPTDLGRDIYVNEIAQARGRTYRDPEVEVFGNNQYNSVNGPKLDPIIYRP